MHRSQHLARSTVLIIAGCALGSLAVGAVRSSATPAGTRLGEVGYHRGQKDSLLFNHQGRVYRLRYDKWPSELKEGLIHYTGSVFVEPWVEPDRLEDQAEGEATVRRGVVGPRITPRGRSDRAPGQGPPQARERR